MTENTASRTYSTIPDAPAPTEQEASTSNDAPPTEQEAQDVGLYMEGQLVGTNDPDMPGTSDVGELPTEEDTEQGDDYEEADEEADEEAEEADEEGLIAPTSNDVGKQTLTKADLGYDVYTEGVRE